MIDVAAPRMKSSADSISRTPVPEGREPVAIRPFGDPVLKLNESAAAIDAARAARPNVRNSFPGERIKRVILLGAF